MGATGLRTPGIRMKWVTRERAKVDRIACPWLITRFVDPKAGARVGPEEKGRAGAGREAAALGFRQVAKDDHDNMRLQFPMYDALYAYCKWRVEQGGTLE